jgi:hypothetical protein
MNTKHFAKLAFTAFVISAAAAAQASEITEFPLNTMSKLSRAEVQADAQKAAQPKGEVGFSYDTATLARESRGSSSRKQMQMDKPVGKSEKMAGAYFIGGM